MFSSENVLTGTHVLDGHTSSRGHHCLPRVSMFGIWIYVYISNTCFSIKCQGSEETALGSDEYCQSQYFTMSMMSHPY